MTVLTDSRYAALAGQAAAALGAGSPAITRAILSQWQCELVAGAAYPPPRNNPGNIARGLATQLGLAFTVAPGSNPQPSNPIVTYPSASIGATAYAKAISSASRYRSALSAARAGDGEGFIRAIGSSGWGTGTSCMLSVYRGSGGTGTGGNNGGPAPAPGSGSSSGGTIVKIFDTRLASSCSQVTILTPSFPAAADIVGSFPIPKESIGDPCVQCAPGWLPAIVTQAFDYGTNGYTDPSTLAPNTPNACVKKGMKEGQRIGPGGIPGVIGDAAGGAFSPQNLGPLIVNGGVAVVAAWLILTGLRDALSGE